MSFYLTEKAKSDLKGIGRYTQETWGCKQRNIYLQKIDNVFYDLADQPDKGRNCDDIRKGYRKYGIGKHFIFYRSVDNETIEIVRILHGNMDIEKRLAENVSKETH